MNRIVTILCAIFMATTAMAQLYAYSINGEVKMQHEGIWNNVYVSDILQNDYLLQTEDFGYIVILDRDNNKKYSLQSATPQSVQTLISAQGKNAPSLFKEYVQHLFTVLLGYQSEETKNMQTSGGVTYRSNNADLVIAKEFVHGTASKAVDFLLLDQQTLQPVQQVKEGQNVVLQVENNSDTPLYVNCIDTDSEGKHYVLLPVNASDSLSEIYIPPYSKIQLRSNPISFSPSGSKEELTLIAYPEPFNISHVIKLIQAEAEQQKGWNNSSNTENRKASIVSRGFDIASSAF